MVILGFDPRISPAIQSFEASNKERRWWIAHSAFEDPTAPPDVLPRESIELRTLLFHST